MTLGWGGGVGCMGRGHRTAWAVFSGRATRPPTARPAPPAQAQRRGQAALRSPRPPPHLRRGLEHELVDAPSSGLEAVVGVLTRDAHLAGWGGGVAGGCGSRGAATQRTHRCSASAPSLLHSCGCQKPPPPRLNPPQQKGQSRPNPSPPSRAGAHRDDVRVRQALRRGLHVKLLHVHARVHAHKGGADLGDAPEGHAHADEELHAGDVHVGDALSHGVLHLGAFWGGWGRFCGKGVIAGGNQNVTNPPKACTHTLSRKRDTPQPGPNTTDSAPLNGPPPPPNPPYHPHQPPHQNLDPPHPPYNPPPPAGAG